ncbi:hypothetical protein Gferi_13100 [Geosporobacter ferrireducens]|uniref:HTH-type transcriptional regulatory protein TyrR n=2 Tax=Geosporobacter ferrireducens TaxID=1424294 RepID=A0A1D8GQF8_9FIRM|nr:hypothetical protein Gferi_13100 [Geosporobacter ferrireducens]MTI58121.1 PAS domain S-box protein [Geosporobacter ferrireducens]
MNVIIHNYKGIHARIAAMIVFRANQINNQYGVYMFIQKKSGKQKIPITSMVALTSLGVKSGDEVTLLCQGEKGAEALQEMTQYLSGQIEIDKANIDEMDTIIENATLTSEKIFESLSNGLVVVDENNNITTFNRAAEIITGLKRENVIGKKAQEVLEDSKLHVVLKTGQEVKGARQKIGKTTIITNRTPVIVEDKIVGAVAIFQDISEIDRLSSALESVKELKERFHNILEHAHDAISMVDDQGIITYVNPAFEEMWQVQRQEILGKNISDTFAQDVGIEVLKSGKKKLGARIQKEDGTKIISNASPIFINGMMKGVVATSKEVTELQKMMEKLEAAEAKVKYFQEELYRKDKFDEAFQRIIGKSGSLREILTIASKAAKTSSTVLIRGESGTGKELLARAIHQTSEKKNKPFIRVNCAAIPESLLESELFGHEKGAFTGAIRRKLGKFELANHGTIFLDEIGDISRDMQVKLLRVLQEREFERVGGLETIKCSVRVVAATNKNLEQAMLQGSFREDLYYRLNVIPITLPPLRDRKGDIPLLAEHFIEKISKRENMTVKGISKNVLGLLEAYHWPGNIRELENIIERALALGEGELLDEDALPGYLKSENTPKTVELVNLVNGEVMSMAAYEKQIIQKALQKHKSFNRAGKALGLAHRTIALKARKYNLISEE